MKIILNTLKVLLVLAVFGAGWLTGQVYTIQQKINQIEAINARIDYLHNEEGYTIEAAKHIADVEFGLVPADAEYKALMED